eukprot:c30514_g1_i1 orf=2-493(-)
MEGKAAGKDGRWCSEGDFPPLPTSGRTSLMCEQQGASLPPRADCSDSPLFNEQCMQVLADSKVRDAVNIQKEARRRSFEGDHTLVLPPVQVQDNASIEQLNDQMSQSQWRQEQPRACGQVKQPADGTYLGRTLDLVMHDCDKQAEDPLQVGDQVGAEQERSYHV